MTYPIKQSRFLLGVLWFVTFLTMAVGLEMICFPGEPGPSGAPLGVVLLLFIPAAWMFTLPQRIVIADGKLTVRHGFATPIKLEISQITRVYPNRNQAAGILSDNRPGWRLCHTNGSAVVLPADEPGFFECLARECPHLRQYGHELRSDPDAILPEPKK